MVKDGHGICWAAKQRGRDTKVEGLFSGLLLFVTNVIFIFFLGIRIAKNGILLLLSQTAMYVHGRLKEFYYSMTREKWTSSWSEALRKSWADKWYPKTMFWNLITHTNYPNDVGIACLFCIWSKVIHHKVILLENFVLILSSKVINLSKEIRQGGEWNIEMLLLWFMFW